MLVTFLEEGVPVRSDTDTRTLLLPVPAVTVVLIGGSLAAAWLATSRDRLQDTTSALAGLPWVSLGVLLLLPVVAAMHYLFAGIALRDVSGRRLPLRQVTLVQLAAAATNRVVPTGLGGTGVNARFLTRAGLSAGAAGSALAGLAVVGGLTDAGYVAAITGLGPLIGLGGAGKELAALAGRSLAGGQSRGWLIAAVASALVAVVVVRARGRIRVALPAALRQAVVHLRALARRPRQVATAAAASMGTTAVLTLGFVLAVHAWGRSATPVGAGGLIALYWVAVAAGGAVPLPAFFGVTEAALIAGLVLTGYTATSATIAVLAFRLVTYWVALPAGVWAGRRLRRAQLL